MQSKIQFADARVKKSFENLKRKNNQMHRIILRAFEDIEENVFCGIQIPKKLIPTEYIKKFKVKNLWKYNLPDAWRLIYSVEGKNLLIFSIILEWLDHKEYERRFNY